jgi:hypothetical protein
VALCVFVLQLRRGFVAVVNRSQKDIKENLPIEDARVQVRGCAAQLVVFAAAFLSLLLLVACFASCLSPGLLFLLYFGSMHRCWICSIWISGATFPPPCVRQVQERQFFERHTVYRCISSRMGTPYLTRLLNSVRGLRT